MKSANKIQNRRYKKNSRKLKGGSGVPPSKPPTLIQHNEAQTQLGLTQLPSQGIKLGNVPPTETHAQMMARLHAENIKEREERKRRMPGEDPASLSFMKLKKWLLAHGVTKEQVNTCMDKEMLLKLVPGGATPPTLKPEPQPAPAPSRGMLGTRMLPLNAPAPASPKNTPQNTPINRTLSPAMCDTIVNDLRISPRSAPKVPSGNALSRSSSEGSQASFTTVPEYKGWAGEGYNSEANMLAHEAWIAATALRLGMINDPDTEEDEEEEYEEEDEEEEYEEEDEENNQSPRQENFEGSPYQKTPEEGTTIDGGYVYAKLPENRNNDISPTFEPIPEGEDPSADEGRIWGFLRYVWTQGKWVVMIVVKGIGKGVAALVRGLYIGAKLVVGVITTVLTGVGWLLKGIYEGGKLLAKGVWWTLQLLALTVKGLAVVITTVSGWIWNGVQWIWEFATGKKKKKKKKKSQKKNNKPPPPKKNNNKNPPGSRRRKRAPGGITIPGFQKGNIFKPGVMGGSRKKLKRKVTKLRKI